MIPQEVHMWKRGYSFVLLFAVIGMYQVHAATINAASCSQADVRTAIDRANSGDIVSVPTGTCAWSTTASYTPSVSVTKAITLKGAGIGRTIIRDETSSKASENLLSISDGARVTGFTFTDMKRPAVTETAEPAIDAGGTDWRIDNNQFHPNNADPGRGVSVSGAGLIDHNVFIDCKQGIEVWGDGDLSWTSEPQTLGGRQAVYIEDNNFSYSECLDGALDAYDGARYVFRHNLLNGTNLGHHGLDSGGLRSTHSWEIYNNRFDNVHEHIWVAFGSRGGSGVVFNNIVTGAYDSFGLLENYRSDDSYATDWGTCDGYNALDGNTPGGQGYPCRDQNGRTTNQAISPIYQWNNSFKGSAATFWVKGYDDSSNRAAMYHILMNRDYYDNLKRPGYTPYQYPHPLQGTCEDHDLDGYTSGSCGGSDCNDSSALINPGVQEICGDLVDNDCDGSDLQCICVHPADSVPCDGCISILELNGYIGRWLSGAVQLPAMIGAIDLWKRPCP
jgi:hypothetical protein